MFGVSLDTLYKWNYYQTGPRYVRVGKYVRYRDSDIEQWLRAREVGGDGATEAVGS